MAIKLHQARVAVTTIIIAVLCEFTNEDGSKYQGEFDGVFKRLSQDQIDDYLDEEKGYRVSEVIGEILVGARGIGDSSSNELSETDGLAWALKQPECVSAAYAAFFKAMRPERYNEKTSKRSRAAGRR